MPRCALKASVRPIVSPRYSRWRHVGIDRLMVDSWTKSLEQTTSNVQSHSTGHLFGLSKLDSSKCTFAPNDDHATVQFAAPPSWSHQHCSANTSITAQCTNLHQNGKNPEYSCCQLLASCGVRPSLTLQPTPLHCSPCGKLHSHCTLYIMDDKGLRSGA
jgi:hypothetical protein